MKKKKQRKKKKVEINMKLEGLKSIHGPYQEITVNKSFML